MADIDALKALVDQQIRESVAAREQLKAEREEAKLERDQAKLDRDQAIIDRDEANRRHDESQQTIKDLLTELAAQRAAHVVPALPGDAGARAAAVVVTRAEKISRMQLNLRKSNKLKEFKESTGTGAVKEWLS